MDIWYHGTPTVNCESIERLGLMPGWRLPGAVEMGRQRYPKWTKKFLDEVIAKDRVHLSRDRWVGYWASDLQETPIEEITTYAVDLEGLPIEPGWDDEDECAVAVTIEPWRLQRLVAKMTLADGVYQVTTTYLCAGFTIRDGVVVDCAPILQDRIDYWITLATRVD